MGAAGLSVRKHVGHSDGPGRVRTGTPEIIRSKVVRVLELEVIDENAVSQGAEGHKGDAEFLASIDHARCLVDGFKGRVLGLNSVNLGD